MTQRLPFIVRSPGPQDWHEWLRMRMALFDETPLAEQEAEMHDYLPGSNRDAAFVAVRAEGGLCGFVEASLRSYADGCDTRPVGYLEGLWVDADARRQGVGAALVAAAERWAGSLGCREMGSDCEAENQVSLQVHQALGYTVSERAIHFCKPLAKELVAPPPAYPAYLYVIRPARGGFFEAPTAGEDEVLARHYERLRQQTEAGVVLLAGPCLDQTFGIVVFRAESDLEAEQFMREDPAVQAGVMTAELHPFRASLIRRMGEWE